MQWGDALMRGIFRACLLTGSLALAGTASQAAGLNPFGPTGLPLNDQDYAAMQAAADPLRNDDTLPIGTTRDWSNPVSGNRGSITLEERFQYDYQGSQLPCRKLRYHAVVRGYSDPYNIRLNFCRIADGSWKIL